MIGERNVRGGLILLSLGLIGGLAMSLYAFTPIVEPPAGFERYDDLPRRLVRLAHIAAIMLPMLNIVLGPVIDRSALGERAKRAAGGLLLFGAATLPAALVAEAAFPGLHLPGVPAAAFVVGVVILTIGHWR